MTMDGGRIIKSSPVRAKAYSLVGAALTVAAVLGIVQADDIDGDAVVDAAFEIVAAATLLMARLNVWLRKPALPPPPH